LHTKNSLDFFFWMLRSTLFIWAMGFSNVFDSCRKVTWVTWLWGWHYSGNMSCATDSGCTCESDELACTDLPNLPQCSAVGKLHSTSHGTVALPSEGEG
jgi:hypothetical protein